MSELRTGGRGGLAISCLSLPESGLPAQAFVTPEPTCEKLDEQAGGAIIWSLVVGLSSFARQDRWPRVGQALTMNPASGPPAPPARTRQSHVPAKTTGTGPGFPAPQCHRPGRVWRLHLAILIAAHQPRPIRAAVTVAAPHGLGPALRRQGAVRAEDRGDDRAQDVPGPDRSGHHPDDSRARALGAGRDRLVPPDRQARATRSSTPGPTRGTTPSSGPDWSGTRGRCTPSSRNPRTSSCSRRMSD